MDSLLTCSPVLLVVDPREPLRRLVVPFLATMSLVFLVFLSHGTRGEIRTPNILVLSQAPLPVGPHEHLVPLVRFELTLYKLSTCSLCLLGYSGMVESEGIEPHA